jgi:hypothetical protein
VTTGGFVLFSVLRCWLYIALLHTDTVNVIVRVNDVQEKFGKEMLRTGGALCNIFSWEDWGNSNNVRTSGVLTLGSTGTRSG